MIGKVELSKKDLQDLLVEHYKKIYGNGISIDVWLENNKAKIYLNRKCEVGNGKVIKIQEQLEDNELLDVLNSVFSPIDYSMVSFETNKQYVSGDGYWDDGYYTFKSLSIVLSKKKEKQKTL